MAIRKDDEEIGKVDPDSLPSSDIEVEAHIHFGMTGSFPLRIGELFLTSTGVYIAEYSYITPMFGLGTRKHRKDAGAMQALFERYGIDAVLLQADKFYWLAYDAIEELVLYSGGRYGRPKVTIFTADHSSYAYRLIGDRDFESMIEELQSVAEAYDLTMRIEDRLGFHPHRNLRRFFTR